MFSKCTRCHGRIREGKRFCKPCAVQTAKEFGFDEYMEPEPAVEEDPVVAYENRHRTNTAVAIGVILLVFTIALWAICRG